jgi:hypothetical protein
MLDDVLTDEGRHRILAGFALTGRMAPDRSRTSLDFVALDSDENRVAERMSGYRPTPIAWRCVHGLTSLETCQHCGRSVTTTTRGATNGATA